MRVRTIVAVILYSWISIPSLFAQGKWKPFVTKINGSPPIGASFLNADYGFVSVPGSTYRTTDGGKTWTHLSFVGNVGKSQFYFYTPANIFFAGAWESQDSGINWRLLPEPASSGNLYIKDNIFYDASGRVSYDHAKTWDTIDKNFRDGESIVGNLDNGIAIWGGSFAIGNRNEDPTLYTTNYGKSWRNGEVGVESDFGYAVPFSRTYFRSGGDGSDAIQRSFDGGATWQNVYGPVLSEYLSDGFGGDGCVIFAQTMATDTTGKGGILRSTDLGTTWQAIGGPVGRDDAPLCGVTSRGAICHAMTYKFGDPLLRFIDSSLLRPILLDTKISRPFPDTLFLSECDSAKISLSLGFSACDFIRFQSLQIDSLPPAAYRLSYSPNSIVRTGISAPASITFFPTAAGTYNLGLHFHLAASDWSGSDTTLPLVIVVSANPATLTIDKTDTIRFAANTLCFAGGKETIHLSNLSCRGLKVGYIHFEADQMTKYDFSFAASSQITLGRGTPTKTIVINFRPITPGIKNGNLIIETSIGSDTIPISAVVLPDPKILIMNMSSFQSPICDSSDGTIYFRNLSCREIRLDSLRFPPPYRLLPVRLPVILDPGDSVLLHVHFSPSQRGSSQVTAKAHLVFSLPYGDEHFDTAITLNGFATHGPSAFALSAKSLDFDTVHLCDSAKSHFVFYSVGCDSLPLNSIVLSGDPDFSLSENGKRNIAAGDSIVLDVALNPLSGGSKQAVVTITLADGSKTTIPLTASIARPVRILSSGPSDIMDLGTHLTCEYRDTAVKLTNHCCDSITIFGTWITGRGFAVQSGIFPIVIPPYEERSIMVFTLLDTSGGTGVNTASLHFISNADNAVAPITLTHSYLFPHPVHIWLDADKASLTAQSVWKVRLKALPNELTDVRTLHIAAGYDSDLLGYLQNKSSGLNSITSSDGKNFTISGFPLIAADADSSIAELEFEVYLTKDTITPFSLNSIVLNADEPKFTGCVAYPLSSGIEFTYLNSCDDRLIRKSMHGQVMGFSIRPNPVQEEFEIALQSPEVATAKIEILDALGARIFAADKILESGLNKINLNTHSFGAGVFVIRIRAGENSASQTFLKIR
ncbi:MAG: choice-of-anchor D domain-containing protein [Bacteroidota bacterium]|nr:choice-of-anchor D domain-containing protein [Bacteroidota bacterium]